jgi:hypothetical protein
VYSTLLEDLQMTVQELHDKFFRDNYDIVPKASRTPTRDSVSIRTHGPSVRGFGPDDAIRFPTARERGQTRDEVLSSMNSGQVISRGTVWDGTGVNAKLDQKVAPIRAFVRGFVLDNIVGAESPGTVISLGRVFAPHVQDDDEREALTRAMDDAEEEWRRDKRSTDTACDEPPTKGRTRLDGRTADGRAMTHLRNSPGTNSGISGQRYQDSLRKGRAAMATQDRATPTVGARVTAQEFAALRAGKGRS